MFHGVFMGRTCCRFSTLRFEILRHFSGLSVQQSRNRVHGPSKHLCLSRVVSRRTYTTQGDKVLNAEQTKHLEIPAGDLPKFPQELTNENTNNDFDNSIPELFEGDDDTSDPCAGLDFNDTINENVDVSKNTNELAGESIEDERFPIPSEPLDKAKIYSCLKAFFSHHQVEAEAKEHGLDRNLFVETFKSFRRNIFKEAKVDTDLYNILYELQNGIGHVDDLLPYFLSYAKRLYPVLDCLEELQEISDFRGPADLFPEARAMKRKFIFHAGPTNSGKTHKALERFQNSKSGIYCGPLRLLASEVYQKTNDNGIPCDLITGEERRWAVTEKEPSNHLACTVEVCSDTREYDCAVIDEIQMIAESERGFAWTKALLGNMYKNENIYTTSLWSDLFWMKEC